MIFRPIARRIVAENPNVEYFTEYPGLEIRSETIYREFAFEFDSSDSFLFFLYLN